MSNRKDNENDTKSDDWEFSAVTLNVKVPKKEISQKIKATSSKLVLEESTVPRGKTRSAMAIDIQGPSKNNEDIYSYAPFFKRALASIIDLFFIAAILTVMQTMTPMLLEFVKYFFDNYHLELPFAESLEQIIFVISSLCALFFLTVIPLAFFNYSFGKKMMKLKVRGAENYTISISQAFCRELIMKPIGIIIIAGFVTPFYSKRKLSIHDMVTQTFVIDD